MLLLLMFIHIFITINLENFGGNMSTIEKQIEKANWALDKAHSKIRFSAKHMVITEVDGQFDDFNIDAFSEKEDLSDAEVEVRISTKSVNTQVADRDNHLRSADFFDAENFPYITFVGKSFTKISDEKYKLTGDLTIKDVTKPVELDVNYGGKIKDPWGNTRIGLNVKGSLDRFDYNLKWNALIETGGAVVGKTINFNCDVEFTKVEE